ncbi:hypothetical protein ACRALDRAFT_1065400 [Sodiomyces alcalophilus JCM 7366]|uniref:uncharacterized protein n=1 Tax=Sodiomyces alcalophilus JCM 7366 TaxID=591952 RepID=UPI0039B65DB2
MTRKNGRRKDPSSPSDTQKQVHKTKSWYGSWPRTPNKSSASIPQIARETIHGGTVKPPTTPDLRKYEQKTIDAPNTPRDADDAAATVHDDGETTLQASDESQASTGVGSVAAKEADTECEPTDEQRQATPTTNDDASAKDTAQQQSVPQHGSTSSGWFGWLGRSTAVDTTVDHSTECPSQAAAEEEEQQNQKQQQQQPQQEQQQQQKQKQKQQQPEEQTETETSTNPVSETPPTPKAEETQPPPAATAPSRWFSFWVNPKPTSDTQDDPSTTAPPSSPQNVEPHDTEPRDTDTPMPDAPPPQRPQSPAPSAGSTWAFWSRDVRSKRGTEPTPPNPRSHSDSGELAVIGQGSEAKPEPACGMEVTGNQCLDAQKEASPKQRPAAGKKTKRLRPESMDIDDTSSVRSGASASAPQPASPSKPSAVDSTQVSTKTKQRSTSESQTKALPPNLLLPSFSSTYRMKDNPSILKQITQFLLRTRQPPANHVFRVKDPPKIKKAIAIGVHGLFPASYLRPMIGQPTGTSIRLANQCAESIRRWVDANGCSDCEIEKVALEGEGKIANRVDNLWKLLLNWIDHIRSADLILLACHSQGVPVAVILLAKLIDLGVITDAKIGVCAMAGVSLGPFPDYKSSMGMLMGNAAELWQFSNPDSEVSKRYEVALKEVLEYGVRMTYIGSIDDQLVPLESAIYSPASHPYIYRAVFIDGRVHAPDFIAHLVGFALKLRNLGISDHGLIRELSTPLAGSLYSGEGHSRLYWDDQVYDLAVAHALETTDIPPHTPNRQCQIRHHRPPRPEGAAGSASASLVNPNPNPYHLPWIMRGLLEEDFVKTELSSETDELLRQFDAWKPVTKALRDVKYRLEAVRSKI